MNNLSDYIFESREIYTNSNKERKKEITKWLKNKKYSDYVRYPIKTWITKYEHNDDKEENDGENNDVVADYVLNINSKKFHLPGKSCAESIKEENREYFNGTK